MSTYLCSTRGCDGERRSACVCVPLKRVPSGSLPFFDVGAIYDSTTLHNILLSTRVPRDSSLLCDRTIYIYIRFASSSSVRCFVNTRDHHHQQRSRTRKKNPPLPPPPFGTSQQRFLLSHVLFKVFSYSSGVFVLICSACNPFSLNSSSRSEYTCRCLATCFMP